MRENFFRAGVNNSSKTPTPLQTFSPSTNAVYREVTLPLQVAVETFDAEEFSPYLKENTTLHHYKDQLVNAV
jgi:hypothetical protein